MPRRWQLRSFGLLDRTLSLKRLQSSFRLWPHFDSHIKQMITLRNRGSGHRHLGPFTDKDLSLLCKCSEQLLRTAGAAHEADFVQGSFPQYVDLAKVDSSALLVPKSHSIEEFLAMAGPAAGMPKPSMQITETNTPDNKTLSFPSKTLTLKPRNETGTVRQSFSHGRTKQQVVEKHGRRVVETETPEDKPLRLPLKTLSLKPRTETGTVRQSFSHGRTKQKVVEKRGPRRRDPD